MDRRSRRYVPSSEGLEDRQMLSTTPAINPTAAATNPLTGVASTPGVQIEGAAATQQTIEAKRHRIQNLPYFIGLLNKDGAVPQPTVQNIQNDLNSMVASLLDGDPSLVASFNLDLRKAQAYEDITPTLAADLNRDFGAVLVSAKAAPATVADLQKQMTSLIDYDSNHTPSTIAATNDYSMVLQLAQITGRPLVYPNVPALLAADHNGNDGKIPITQSHRPSLTGNYAIGVSIQIVDRHNKVILGQGRVNPSTGVYTIQFANPLANGTYTVRTRVQDDGVISDPSPIFTFEVKAPAPKVIVAAATPTGPAQAK